MKRKKIMTIGLISLITIFVSLVTVEASTWTSTGRINNLPTYGKVKDLNIYNKKTTSTQIASFQTTEVSASLPTFGRLRNSNGALRSEWVYLDLEIMYPLSFLQMKNRFTQVKDSVNCLDSK